jgi:Prokaryotic E2 family E
MTPEVEAAIAGLRAAFPHNAIEVDHEEQGGAYVIVRDLALGSQYQPARSWVGFLIPHTYPYAEIYPHFTDPDLARVDAGALGEGFQRTPWRDRLATQISRSSNGWNATTDTATLKLKKVLTWVAER